MSHSLPREIDLWDEWVTGLDSGQEGRAWYVRVLSSKLILLCLRGKRNCYLHKWIRSEDGAAVEEDRGKSLPALSLQIVAAGVLSLLYCGSSSKSAFRIFGLWFGAMSPSQSYLSCSWCWMLVHRVPRGFLCALANRIICEITTQNYILDNWRDQHQIIQLLKDSKRSLIGGLEFESSSPIKIFRPENCKSMWSLRSSLKKCDHQDFICVGACMDR